MRKFFWVWARIIILATPKTLDVPMDRLRAIVVARLLTLIVPATSFLAYILLIELFPALIHFFAVALLLILVPIWIIGMWRFHKLGKYFKRKQNTL